MPPPPYVLNFTSNPPLSLVVIFSYAPPPHPPPGNYCTVPNLLQDTGLIRGGHNVQHRISASFARFYCLF